LTLDKNILTVNNKKDGGRYMSKSSKLYNKDLAPTPSSEKKYGGF